MILTDLENLVRLDLFDPAGPNQRWSLADLDRAIDHAVTHYSQYAPNIGYADMQSQPFQRTYPYPTSWNPTYPVMWIERILSPLQVKGSQFAAPATGANAAQAPGAGLSIGLYTYAITFISQGGETTQGPTFQVTTNGGNQQVSMSNIPTGPAQTAGNAGNTIIGRNLYRSLVGGGALFLLATIQNNSTTAYLDSASDASISGMPSPPTVNTSGVMYWPPINRSFAEFSNLFDSRAAIAAGGNVGLMGSVGTAAGPTGIQEPTFTLHLRDWELPTDTTSVLRVFYATKHQLDANGSTIPEIHKDIIVIGASAYACLAYQVPTNDNFDFQDGTLRDRVDDTHIPESWASTAQTKMQQFMKRLQEIKHNRDFGASARAQWGDVGRSWSRL